MASLATTDLWTSPSTCDGRCDYNRERPVAIPTRRPGLRAPVATGCVRGRRHRVVADPSSRCGGSRPRRSLAGLARLRLASSGARDALASTWSTAIRLRVERAHRLRGVRQAGRVTAQGRCSGCRRAVRPDVEPDGRLFHDSAGHRDRDLDSDLEAAVSAPAPSDWTRGQVFERPPHPVRLARLLQRVAAWTPAPVARVSA
jgi:hypothetical protein